MTDTIEKVRMLPNAKVGELVTNYLDTKESYIEIQRQLQLFKKPDLWDKVTHPALLEFIKQYYRTEDAKIEATEEMRKNGLEELL